MVMLPNAAHAAPGSSFAEAPLLPQTVVGLRQGSTGSGVKAVQEALMAAGVAVRGGADGVFGSATKSAVSTFQTKKGIPETGAVDSATAAALGLAPSSTPAATSGSVAILSIGAKGEAVKALQKALMGAGVFVPGGADGSFGQATKTAVSSFQRWNGLTVTGTLTPATAKALGLSGGTVIDAPANASAGATRSPAANPYVGLRIGAQGAHVKALQSALIEAGMAVHGGADGSFGNATKTALTKYQGANGLASSGTVDADTAANLGLGGAPAATPSAPTSSAYVGLKVGSNGTTVKELQRALIQAGLTLRGGADGVFGNATKSTLIIFQKANGLSQTGVLTEKGAGILGLGGTSGPQGVTSQAGYPIFGETGDRVRQMQQSLLDAGIKVPGGADGQFGASTAGAIMDFQRRESLPVTGKIDEPTATKLGNAKAPAPTAPSSAGVKIDVFPIQGRCSFIDTWHAPRGGGRLHVGTDIISSQDKLVYAVVDGKISKQYHDYPGALAGNGLRVAQPNGTYFTYLHLSGFAPGIEVGVPVKAGDVIGYVGMTGNAATPHVHFEVHPNGGSSVNPYPLIKAVDACNVTAPRS